MIRWAAISLIISFIAIGSGAIEYLHNLGHALEDSLEDRAAMLNVLRLHHIAVAHTASLADRSTPVSPTDHHHDDSNCPVHAQLHIPIITGGYVAVLVCLGLWVAFLTQLPHLVVRRLHLPHFDSRGPPLAIVN